LTSADFRRRLAVAALLAVASLALYGWAPRYRLVGDELLRNANFSAGIGGWQSGGDVTIAGGTATLRNSEASRIIDIDQRIADPAPGYYSFSAEVRPEGVVRGPHHENAARLVFAAIDAAGNAHWENPHTVVALVGTGGWRRYARVFPVPPKSSALWAIVQLYAATGTFAVRDLSVRRAEPLLAFTLASRALLGLWVGAGSWIVWPLLRAVRRDPRSALVAAVVLGIGVATQMPNPAKTALLLWVYDSGQRVEALLHAPPAVVASAGGEAGPAAVKAAEARFSWRGLDKLGHFLMHVLLGLVSFWAFRRQSRVLVLLCLVCFAGVTEIWQNFAIDRDPLLSDAAINIGGVLTGAALMLIWLRLRRSKPA